MRPPEGSRSSGKIDQDSSAESMRSSRSAGSRSVGAVRVGRSLDAKLVGRREDAQPSLLHERGIHRAESSGERRVGGNAERDRLAVHRPAGRDDEVGERDEALRVERPARDDERGQRTRVNLRRAARSCVGGRRRARPGRAPSRSSTSAKSGLPCRWYSETLGRRPHDDDRRPRSSPSIVEDSRVGLESVEVVLLLEAWIAAHLPRRARRAGRDGPAGWRPGRRPGSRHGSRARAAPSRTRSRTRTQTGSRASARRSEARATRARARRRTPDRARTAGARAARPAMARAFPTAPAPPCRGPTASCSIPWRRRSSSGLRVLPGRDP